MVRLPDQVGPWDDETRKNVSNWERNQEKRALSAFFSFCLTREWCESSPVAKVKASTVEGSDPEAYDPEEAQQIMSAAVRYEKLCPEDESLVPCIAMGFFAGMRRKEIMRLDWEEGEETVAIKGKGKGLKRRVIDMTPTCIENPTPRRRVPCGLRIKRNSTTASCSSWLQNRSDLHQLQDTRSPRAFARGLERCEQTLND